MGERSWNDVCFFLRVLIFTAVKDRCICIITCIFLLNFLYTNMLIQNHQALLELDMILYETLCLIHACNFLQTPVYPIHHIVVRITAFLLLVFDKIIVLLFTITTSFFTDGAVSSSLHGLLRNSKVRHL